MQKIVPAFLFTGLALCLLQIWLPAYYLTGDGPCHAYNAQILHDLWDDGKNADFYRHFYTVAYKPDPNWFSTFVLASLMFFVNGIIAEKILLTLYVLLFIGGFYSLLKRISSTPSLWMLSILVFVFPNELSKGFYNSTFSIAFYFWAIWSWLRFLERKSPFDAFVFLLFTALVYFTHLLAFGFEVFTCGALVLSFAIAEQKKSMGKYLAEYAGWLALLLAPFAMLMLLFTQKEGGLQLSLTHHFYRLVELAQLKYIVNVTTHENAFALIAGVSMILLFCFAFTRHRVKAGISKYDGFLLALLFSVFVLVCFPDSFMGRLILINVRVQPIVGALMICCIAYLLPENKTKAIGAFVLFTCFICLTIVRICCMSTASGGASEYVSAGAMIKPYSVVLPLGFAPSGKDEHGQVIADWNFLFSHAADYIGLKKPVIMLDNYEANMGYFPIRWNKAVNPYNHLSKYEGIEGVPPYATIAEYKLATGVNIDYVLMWCYDPSFLANAHFRALSAEIKAGYHKVFTSVSGRTVLYEINGVM